MPNKNYNVFSLPSLILQYQRAQKLLENKDYISPVTKISNREILNNIQLRLVEVKDFFDPDVLPSHEMLTNVIPRGCIVVYDGDKEGKVVGFEKWQAKVIVRPFKQIQLGVDTILVPRHKIKIKYVQT